MKHARAVFDSAPLATAASRAEAVAAASELLGAIGLFIDALPLVKDARSNELIRRHVSGMLNDSARLRALSLTPEARSDGEGRGEGLDDAGRRRRVAQELFDTEKSYVASLTALIKVLADPLQPCYEGFAVTDLTDAVLEAIGAAVPTVKPGELLSSDEHSLLFDAARQLLPLNQMMLDQLQELLTEWSEASCVGDVLFTYAPFMKMYCESFTRQIAAGELLQKLRAERPGFADFLASATAACKGQTIESLLIMPVQRIPRYRLLLEQLLKYTPQDHPDFARCAAALSQVSAVAADLNESLRRFEQRTAMHKAVYSFRPPLLHLIQPHRSLLREGTLDKLRVAGVKA
jgi:hypothetical protein